ncbi:MAG TPA: hypothetical protein ENH55_09570 [Aurantimonas coralicida]|uniref:Uncharacterized protein n=2 Tax=root TaxID=1 RepID=A0A9C9NGK3_9HYPH|nr:hypothetical protein [Aurantimonas coralicida]HEU01311.1 hypothetical protein [Aurantimonas coralicida]
MNKTAVQSTRAVAIRIDVGTSGIRVANNVLKTDYDASAQAWPDWIEAVGMPIAVRLTLSPSAVP